MPDGLEWLAENYKGVTNGARGSWWNGGASDDGDGRYFYRNDIFAEEAAIGNGWRIPTLAEWKAMRAALGGEAVAGGKLKTTGTTFWNSPNTGAVNTFGFGLHGSGGCNDAGPIWDYKKTISFAWTRDTEPDGSNVRATVNASSTSAALTLGSSANIFAWRFPMRLVRDSA